MIETILMFTDISFLCGPSLCVRGAKRARYQDISTDALNGQNASTRQAAAWRGASNRGVSLGYRLRRPPARPKPNLCSISNARLSAQDLLHDKSLPSSLSVSTPLATPS